MKAIFKGETVVRTKLTLDTGLEKLDGSDVRYFVREPKLIHNCTNEDWGIVLEKDLSFNKIMLINSCIDEVVLDGITLEFPDIVYLNPEEDKVIFEVGGSYTIKDKDEEEKIETYHKLMEAYNKQVRTREENEDNCCGCGFCSKEGDFSGEEYDEIKGFNEENIEKKAMDDLNEILTAFFGDVPGFKCQLKIDIERDTLYEVSLLVYRFFRKEMKKKDGNRV